MSEELREEVEEVSFEDQYADEYDKAWDDEEDDNLEQPTEEVESDVDEQDEADEEDSIEQEIADEDKPVEESEDGEEEESSDDFAEVLKWNKKEIPVTRDELIALAQKGFDADKKWREASIDRPLKEIIKDNELTAEELKMVADVLRNKNPEALAMMANKAGIDLYEAEHKDYKPVVEEKNYELDDVIAEINQNEEIATQMNDYVSSVPQTVKDVLVSNPQVLRGLNIDMQQGIAQKVMPEVIKQLAINPNQDFVRLYQQVGQKIYSQEEQPKGEEKPKRVEPSREEKKRVVVSKKNSAPTKTVVDDYDAVWDDDKHFDAVLQRLGSFN